MIETILDNIFKELNIKSRVSICKSDSSCYHPENNEYFNYIIVMKSRSSAEILFDYLDKKDLGTLDMDDNVVYIEKEELIETFKEIKG